MRIATLLCMLLAFAAAAEKRSFVINSATVKWEAMNPPGVPKGLTQKLLHDNKQNQLQSSIVRFPKGYREPRHYHKTCGHSMYILKGRIQSPDGDLTQGTFTYAATNERHGPFVALEETEFLFYTDGPFDFYVEDKR
jgi:quercetin dioxygenase-like cupin family protein